MNISVIICTYNRSSSLQDTIQSLLRQEIGNRISFEILIIDNNSTDDTKLVVETKLKDDPIRLKYFFEEKQGISFARNKGVKEAQGSIIAFTDDDCIVDQYWLQRIKDTFEKYDASAVYGKILPLWNDLEIPKWIVRDNRIWSSIGHLDYGEQVKLAKVSSEQFFGANFSIKRDDLLDLGLFNENLGVKGRKHYLGEETEIYMKLLNKNKKIIYNPSLIVQHKIEKSFLTKDYFRKRNFYGGISFSELSNQKEHLILGIPFWFIKESLGHLLKLLRFTVMLKSKDAFRTQLICIYDLGAIKGFLKKGYDKSQRSNSNV